VVIAVTDGFKCTERAKAQEGSGKEEPQPANVGRRGNEKMSDKDSLAGPVALWSADVIQSTEELNKEEQFSTVETQEGEGSKSDKKSSTGEPSGTSLVIENATEREAIIEITNTDE
jgi:hypothetical protein